MDSQAKHYRAMRNAVWLYLYLLLNADRRTGLLMRKTQTVCKDMGVTRDTALRWLNTLRGGGYVRTLNTGRSLTIQVTRWKALAGAGRNRLQESEASDFSCGKHPTPRQAALRAIPSRTGAAPALA